NTLWPLYGYWQREDERRLLSWGIWWRERTATGENGKRGLDTAGWAFLYHWAKTPEGNENRVFFPLYWHLFRQPSWQVDVLFPVYTGYRDGDTRLTVIPPVIRKTSPERTTTSLLFLYWRDVQAGRGSSSFFPLYHFTYTPERKMWFTP